MSQTKQINDPESPFSFQNSGTVPFPVLLSVPHAGRIYPIEIQENLRVAASSLLRLEDRYADRLVSGACSDGFSTIVAHRPRAWIDLNRNKSEIDADMVTELTRSKLPAPSRKTRGGLGLVPRRLSGTGELWQKKWRWTDIKRRIEIDHEPYHRAIEISLRKMAEKFGGAILLDVHSMPPLSESGVDIVIGDRFGRSAGSRFSELSSAFCERAGYGVRLNHPYAGGYILERHGNPENGIHAIQLEVDRRCYLDTSLREPGPGLTKVNRLIKNLASLLANQIDTRFQLAAAE